MISGLTWELVRRSDQSVLTSLDDRLEGSRVVVTRGSARTAEVPMALDDPDLALAGVGGTLLRVTVPGWPVPLFLGRITQVDHSYDPDTEGAKIQAGDPLVQLDRSRVFVPGLGFDTGAEGYKEFIEVEQGEIMWQMVNLMSANGTGIIRGSHPSNQTGSATMADDASTGSFPWSNPGFVGARDGYEASAYTNVVAINGITHYLRATNFGLDLPSTAIIEGIKFDVWKRSEWAEWQDGVAYQPYDYSVRMVKGGAIVGTDHAHGNQWSKASTMDSYGATNDLWGVGPFTAAQVNSPNFGLVFAGYTHASTPGGGFGVNNHLYVDFIKVTVYWREFVGGELLATPSLRTVTFPAGSSCADAVKSVAAMRFAPEFELEPAVGSDGRIAKFNVYYPRQGTDKSATVKLQMGIDENDNTLSFSYSPTVGGMVNRYTAIGDQAGIANKGGLQYPNHPAWRSDHAASQAQYGVWGASDVISGLTDFGLLKAAADGVVAANAMPIDSFTASIDPDTGPELKPGVLWIGDTIAAEIGFPTEAEGEIDVQGRITVASFTEVDSGEVYVDITCEPSDVLGLTGNALNVVVDSAEGTVPPPPDEVASDNPCADPGITEPDPCAKKKKGQKGGKGKKGKGKHHK